jgi:hypothetical protein
MNARIIHARGEGENIADILRGGASFGRVASDAGQFQNAVHSFDRGREAGFEA